MFYEDEQVRTYQKVTKDTRDILVANGIRPGQIGIVVSEVTYVTVNFNGKIVTLKEDAIESVPQPKGKSDDEQMNILKNMFGMK